MITVVIGPPCAGKSTYIKEYKNIGDLVVDYDEMAQALGAQEKHNAIGIVKKAAFEAREAAINVALKFPEKDSWIIHTKPTKEQLENYEKAGAEIVELDPGIDVCLERARQDNRPQCTFDGIRRWYAEEKGNNMKHKVKSFEMKAQENGTIAGYFSTYDDMPDSYGDIIEKGAFTETLKKRKESGHPFPLCFNHDFSAVIGAVKKTEETEKGPYIEAEFLDTQLAQDVRKMLKSGAIYQFSFAYDVLQSRVPNEDEKKKGIMNVLQKVEVFEVSVVTVPANQNAVVTDVKSGRRNRKSDEEIIKNCIESLKSLLDDGEGDKPAEDDADKEKAAPKVNEASEEPKAGSNSEKAAELLEKIYQTFAKETNL